jgi:hypothetical protein
MKNKQTQMAGSKLRATIASGLILVTSGCSHAPSINILGSFFPSWMLCGLIGIVLTVLVRIWFLRVRLESELIAPLILVYPCLTAFFTFSLWLLFFS